jgi:hypothetical protein
MKWLAAPMLLLFGELIGSACVAAAPCPASTRRRRRAPPLRLRPIAAKGRATAIGARATIAAAAPGACSTGIACSAVVARLVTAFALVVLVTSSGAL